MPAPTYVQSHKQVRAAAFAGTLYSDDAARLSSALDAALAAVPPKGIAHIRTLIVPHGNHAETLPALAAAYREVRGIRYERIVVLTGSTEYFPRITVSGSGFFETPLGKIVVSDYTRNELADEEDDIFISEQGFENNAALETQLPLIQAAIGGEGSFNLLPLVMGDQSVDFCNELSLALSEVLQSKSALIIAVSNFSTGGEIEEVLTELGRQDYAALVRRNLISGGKIADGLGAVAVAARISEIHGAKQFSLLHREALQNQTLLSASFSK